MNTPKECPFCGQEPIGPAYISSKYSMYCPCCEYFGPVGASAELAIEAWNERSEVKDATS